MLNNVKKSNLVGTRLRHQPTQSRAKQKVALILQTATEIIMKDGAEAVTTRAVAEAAAIPVGSVYKYFEDRKDILSRLYEAAYIDVVSHSLEETMALAEGFDWLKYNKVSLGAFWRRAQAHETFLILTRWHNRSHSMWETIPDEEDGFGQIILMLIERSNVPIPADRKEAIFRTALTAISVLIDQAIEEEDEDKALALIHEIGLIVEGYLIAPFRVNP